MRAVAKRTATIFAARVWATGRSWRVMLFAVLALALCFRLVGLNWDDGHHLHPDERFISIVAAGTKWPSSVGEYFDTEQSPLNPANLDPPASYSYGTFPLFLVKGVAAVAGKDGYDEAFLVGRAVTAVFDVGTVFLVFAIGALLWSRRVGLLAALLLSLTVLHIQLAHFWTVDPYLTFFSTATLYFSLRVARDGRRVDFALCGIAIGLGLASKVTAFPLPALLVLAVTLRLLGRGRGTGSASRRLEGRVVQAAVGLLLSTFAAFAVFRVAQPYAFEGPHLWNVDLSPRFVAVLREQAQLTGGALDSPPFVQWVGRRAYLYPLQNMLLWGLGVPLGLAAFAGVVYAAYRIWRKRDLWLALPLGLLVMFVGLYGFRFATFARYFEPAYPAAVLLAAFALTRGAEWARRRRSAGRLNAVAFALAVAPSAVVLLSALWALAFAHIYSEPHSRIQASRWIYEHVEAGSNITSESWDDPLPLQLESVRSKYAAVPLDLYRTDSLSKIDTLVAGLDRADYVVLSSDRLRKSIPRMPAEYPATSRYYEALDDGSLGFRLVERFDSPPELLGVEIPDAWAEESLTVYDHPTVRIYERTPGYSSARARAVLYAAHPERAVDITPKAGDFNGLLSRPSELRRQRAGGGWRDVFGTKTAVGRFAPETFARQHPALAWFLVLELLSLAALPIVLSVLYVLPDGGYPLAKPIGLLVIGFPVWLCTSLGLSQFSRQSIILSGLVLLAVAMSLAFARREQIGSFLRRCWRQVVLVEALFVTVFLAFYKVRLENPDLWHPFRGGEKPMDLAYLTAVVKSSTLPPYDPWFSGGYLNYYYFGQFLTATLIKALGIAPEVAYNLAIPMFAAFTAMAAFSLAYNLVASTMLRRGADTAGGGAVLAGLAAVLLTLGAGNLDALRQWSTRLQEADAWHLLEGSWFVGGALAGIGGLWNWLVHGAALAPFDWWAPTRVIPNSLSITEFPFFSLLLGDLHAHVMAIPFAMTGVSLSLALVLAGARRTSTAHRVILLVGLALVIGALRAINTWDLPTQLVVAGAAILASTYLVHRDSSWAWARSAGLQLLLLVGLIWFLYLPFSGNYQQFSNGLARSPETTPVQYYVLHFGLLLALGAGLVIVRLPAVLGAIRSRRAVSTSRLRRFRDWLLWPDPRLLARVWLLLAASYAISTSIIAFQAGLATFVIVLAVIVLLVRMAVEEVRLRSGIGPPVVHALLVLALLLTAGVEVVRLSDDVERMNTVFKFYVQAWWLMAIGAAFGAWLVLDLAWRRLRRGVPRRRSVGVGAVSLAAVGLVFGAALLYPAGALAPRLADRFGQTARTPDGTAYMLQATYEDARGTYELAGDYRAVLWTREHIAGSPTILEGVTPLYRWGNRFSIYTGLPAVIGWDFHQTQQRRDYEHLIRERRASVNTFYNTSNTRQALRILQRYEVRYIFVGQLERAYYRRRGLAKIPLLPGVRRVYGVDGVQIYEVDPTVLDRALA